jgi:hypothetical protein
MRGISVTLKGLLRKRQNNEQYIHCILILHILVYLVFLLIIILCMFLVVFVLFTYLLLNVTSFLHNLFNVLCLAIVTLIKGLCVMMRMLTSFVFLEM